MKILVKMTPLVESRVCRPIVWLYFVVITNNGYVGQTFRPNLALQRNHWNIIYRSIVQYFHDNLFVFIHQIICDLEIYNMITGTWIMRVQHKVFNENAMKNELLLEI